MPHTISENNPIDVELPSGTWTRLAFTDAVIHAGPVTHQTLVHLLVDAPDDTVIEGQFYLTDTNGDDPSHYLPVTHRGGGGLQFTVCGHVPDGRHLRFQVRATTPDGQPVTLQHRTASATYWPA